MNATPHRILLVSLLLAGAAASPAAAAGVRHVETTGVDNPSCSAASPCATLYHALGVAAGGDTIRLGAGSFDDPGMVAKPVTIEGAGPQTVLVGGLTMSASVTVRSLRAVPGGNGFTLYVPSGYAPQLRVEDAVVEGAEAALELRGGSLIAERVTIKGTGPDTEGVSFAGTAAVLRHVTFDAAPGLLRSVRHREGEMRIEDSVLAGRSGLSSTTGPLTVERTRIDATGTAAFLGASENGTRTVAITDSVLIGRGTTDPGRGIEAQSFTDGATLALEVGRSTLMAGGDEARALAATAVGADVQASLTGTVAAAGTDLFAYGASITAAGSAFRTADTGPGGTVTAPGTAGNLAVDPRLAADGSLGAGSPLIDAAAPALLPAGALDAAGAPRVTDGDGDGEARPDIGGLERPAPVTVPAPPVPPAPPVAPVPPVATQPDVVAPAVGGLKVVRRTRPAVRFTLSEAATVRVTLRRAQGRLVRRVVRQKTAGRARIKFRRADLARPGRYTVRVVAVDAAGNRAAPAKRAFRVRPR